MPRERKGMEVFYWKHSKQLRKVGTGSSFSVRYVAKETEDPKLSSLKIGWGKWVFTFLVLLQLVVPEGDLRGLQDTDFFPVSQENQYYDLLLWRRDTP